MKSGRVPGVVGGWAISTDKGKSFQFGGYVPQFERPDKYTAADSWLQRDDQGNFFLNILSWEKEKSVMHLYHMNKRNLGVWKKVSNPIDCRAEDGVLDRPILITNNSGLFLSYTFFDKKRRIKMMQIIKSTDKGKTWSLPKTLSNLSQKTRGGGVSTVCLNNHILSVWIESNNQISMNEIWYAFSKDSGKTFSKSQMFYKLNHEKGLAPEGHNIGQGLGPITMDITPVLGIVKNKKSGYIQLVCNEGTEAGSRLVHFYFDPLTEKIKIQKSPSTSPDSVFKIFPAVPLTYNIPAVLYYDRRNDIGRETLTDIYLSFWKDEKLFEVKINSVSSNWSETKGDSAHAPMQRVYGDYISIASHENRLFAVWTDGRSGVPRIYGRQIEIK